MEPIESAEDSLIGDLSLVDDVGIDDLKDDQFPLTSVVQPTPRQRLLQAQNLDNQISINQVLEDKLIIEDYSAFPTDIIIDTNQHVYLFVSNVAINLLR